MFANLGKTLGLLRELRGKSQGAVARQAGIGKSQLSKYENGRELPKLDSLEKILGVLEVGYFELFYTLYLVDHRAAGLERPAEDQAAFSEESEEEAAGFEAASRPGLLADSTDQAFTRIFTDLLALYRQVFEQSVMAGEGATRARSSSHRAAASSPPRSASPP